MSRTLNPVAERLYQEAKEQFRCSNYEEAIVSLQQAIAIEPDYWEAWYLRGLSYTNCNWDALEWNDEYFEQVIASFDRVIAIQPENSDVWIDRAQVLQALKRDDEAVANLAQALNIQPIDCYDHALEIAPDSPDVETKRQKLIHKLESS